MARRVLSQTAAFLAVAYAFCVTMLSTTLPTPLYPLYQEQLGFSELIVTVVFATYAAGVLLALTAFGSVSDAIGRRRTLLPALAAAALSAILFLTEVDLPMLLAGRLLSGLAAGLFTGTATAALLDLAGEDSRGRASVVATLVNMGGLGLGPLLAGLLAEYGPSPLRVTYVVDLILLAPALVWVYRAPETVQHRSPARRPSFALPPEVRRIFAQAALSGFAGFVVLGTFTAVSPAALSEVLHESSHAVVGLVVFLVFASSTAGQLLLPAFNTRTALPTGAAALTLGALLVATALWSRSLAVLIVGGVVAGLGQGLGFRAGMAAVNAATPADRRASVTSVLFAVLYVGISLPVVGIGVAADAAGMRAAGIGAALTVAAVEAIVAASLLWSPATDAQLHHRRHPSRDQQARNVG
ncbi:MAG TPA: MFS transporter [Jatrophihabitans sp.]|nr:MFS transporter [Jatrophihabitans sp.]